MFGTDIEFGTTFSECPKLSPMEFGIRRGWQRITQLLLHFPMQHRQPVERDTGKRMMHSVISHIPADPAHKPISAKRSRIPQGLWLMC